MDSHISIALNTLHTINKTNNITKQQQYQLFHIEVFAVNHIDSLKKLRITRFNNIDKNFWVFLFGQDFDNMFLKITLYRTSIKNQYHFFLEKFVADTH